MLPELKVEKKQTWSCGFVLLNFNSEMNKDKYTGSMSH